MRSSRRSENCRCVFLYCDFQSQKIQTPENVLGALVKQIVRRPDMIPTEIAAVF